MCVCVCVCITKAHISKVWLNFCSWCICWRRGESRLGSLPELGTAERGLIPQETLQETLQHWQAGLVQSPVWDHHFFPLGPDARQMLPVPPCFLQSWGGLAFKFRGPSKSLSINYHWFHSKCIQHAYKVLTLSWTSLHSSHWIQNSNLSKRGGHLDNPGKDFCWNILVLASASVQMFAGWCSSACSNTWFILPWKEEIHCQQRLIVLHGRY